MGMIIVDPGEFRFHSYSEFNELAEDKKLWVFEDLNSLKTFLLNDYKVEELYTHEETCEFSFKVRNTETKELSNRVKIPYEVGKRIN